MTTNRILLVDDHELFRSGLCRLIESQPDMSVIGEAADGIEAIQMATLLRPDLIIMDISMPSCDGIEATTRICAEDADARIVILSVRNDEETFLATIRAGARGFLPKNTESKHFVQDVRRALRGEYVLPPFLCGALVREYRSLAKLVSGHSRVQRADSPKLTKREFQILALIVDDANNNEIADVLSISIHTVKSHVRNLLRKLQVTDRQTAKRYALEHGLVTRNL